MSTTTEAGLTTDKLIEISQLVKRAGDEAVQLRIVERFLSEVERRLLKATPHVFDIERVLHHAPGFRRRDHEAGRVQFGLASAAVTGDEGVASLEIATRCLETSARPAAAASVRKGPRRVVG